jgi:hypothetical protein
MPLRCGDGEPGVGIPGFVRGELSTLELPLLPPAVEERNVVEAAQFQDPVGVGGEPVVVAPVQDL